MAEIKNTQPPSSTPGEVERLLDEYTHEVAQMGMAPWCSDIDLPATHRRFYELRTALLSHISTAGRGDGAGVLRGCRRPAAPGCSRSARSNTTTGA